MTFSSILYNVWYVVTGPVWVITMVAMALDRNNRRGPADFLVISILIAVAWPLFALIIISFGLFFLFRGLNSTR